MIKEKRNGMLDGMTQRESFDSFYTKKLEALNIELKAIIKRDIPYVVSPVYACKVCSGRLMVHSQENSYCLRCQVPPMWARPLKALVDAILSRYPSYAETVQEWEASNVAASQIRQPREAPARRAGDVTLGERIRAARLAREWTQEDLAMHIYRKDGRNVAKSSIQGYESGNANPSPLVLEQIEKILGIGVEKNG